MGESKRKFLTFLTGGLAGIGVSLAAIPFFRSLGPASNVKPPNYHRKIEFPKLKPGQMISVATPTGPIYVLKRTEEQIAVLKEHEEFLLDPQSEKSDQPKFARNQTRSLRSDIFVASGLCTHLGCSLSNVQPHDDNFEGSELGTNGGFFCPCHGAAYDLAGRVYNGMPARRNLDVPEYEFVDDSTIRITDEGAF